MLPKQDRQGVRTPAGLEQKYDFYSMTGAASDAAQASAEAKKAAAEATQAAANAQKVAEEANKTADEAKAKVDAIIAPMDYIEERGIDGFYHYEKWASGKAVCWGTTGAMSVKYSAELTESSRYKREIIYFPSGLFVAAPTFVNVRSFSSVSELLEERLRSINASYVQFNAILHSAESTTIDVQFVVEAIGRWKL
jgi:hypothetical protein